MSGGERRHLSGQGMVEAALAIPILALLLVLAVDGSMLFRSQMTAEAAASEAARYVALHPGTTEAELELWAEEAVGVDEVDLTLSEEALPEQSYVMRATDVDGAERTVSAVTRRTATTVSATVLQRLPMTGLIWRASASHAGVTSEEGLQ